MIRAQEDWVLCRVFDKSRRSDAGRKATSNMDNLNVGSSTLPLLVDSYITFDQTDEGKLNEYEQVSCFSSIFSPHIPHMELPHMLAKTTAPIFGGMPIPDLPSLSCDKMVLKAMLNQLSNLEHSPSFVDGSPSDSYLSEVGLPPIWNH